MRRLTLPVLLALTAIAAPGPMPAGDSAIDGLPPADVLAAGRPADLADVEIDFWTARIPQDAADHISPTRLGLAYLRRGRAAGDAASYRGAEAALELALARSPGHYPAMAALAESYLGQHRFAEALALARVAADARPDEARAYATIGDAHLETGDLERAAAAYDALERRAGGYAVDARLAGLHRARGGVAAARGRLEAALAHAVRTDAPRDVVVWCHVQLGDLAFGRGDWSRAERSYRAALRVDPASAPALEHLGELRAAQGRYRAALALYDRVRALSRSPEWDEATGDVLAELDDAEADAFYARAERGYRAAAAAGDRTYDRHLARFYTEKRPDPAEAVAWARRDLEIRQDAAGFGTLARALYAAGALEDAREAARRAAAAGPGEADLLYDAAIIEASLGDVDRARAWFEQGLRVNPRSARAAEAARLVRARRASAQNR